jgi:hypothetical protein
MDDNVIINTGGDVFAYTSEDLLKNISFNCTQCAPFKLNHYAALKRFSNGILDHKSVDMSTMDEVRKKFNFKIDSNINYITNIFNYEFVVFDYDLSVIHVVDALTKTKLGELKVSLNNNLIIITTNTTITDGNNSV